MNIEDNENFESIIKTVEVQDDIEFSLKIPYEKYSKNKEFLDIISNNIIEKMAFKEGQNINLTYGINLSYNSKIENKLNCIYNLLTQKEIIISCDIKTLNKAKSNFLELIRKIDKIKGELENEKNNIN